MKLKDWHWRFLGVAVILLVWELYGRSVSPLLLPPFSKVMRELWSTVLNGTLVKAFFQSLQLLLVGVALGTVVGVVLGLVMGRYTRLASVIEPYLLVVYASPRIAVMPLIILWFGLSMPAKIVIVFLTSFFEVLVATVTGVRQVSTAYVEVARSFTLPDRKLFTSVIIPGAFSFILSGIRLGVGHGLVGMVVAELFLETSGIGGLVNNGAEQFRTDRVLAAILTVSMSGVALAAFLRMVERKAAPWHQETFE